MPKVTAISYIFSIIFYGMGYLKTLLIDNAITKPINTYEFTINASLATGYFVLAILFALTGSLLFYVKYSKDQKVKRTDLELKVISRRLTPQLTQPKYGLDLYRRMTS